MVEGNRGTFQLTDAELQSRKRFVAESRRTLEEFQKEPPVGYERLRSFCWSMRF